MNPDLIDLSQAFAAADVRFLIVGAYALAHHSRPRAWPNREAGRFGDLMVDFIGRKDFLRNKRATGRTRDLGDIEDL